MTIAGNGLSSVVPEMKSCCFPYTGMLFLVKKSWLATTKLRPINR
jgi:hypothetical protein